MKRPSDKVFRGLSVLQPVMSIILESPNDSELQECSESDIDDAEAAYEWIVRIITDNDARNAEKLS